MTPTNNTAAWLRYYARRSAEDFGRPVLGRTVREAPVTIERRRQDVLRYVWRHSPAAYGVLVEGGA